VEVQFYAFRSCGQAGAKTAGSDESTRRQYLFKGETKRKRLAIPMLMCSKQPLSTLHAAEQNRVNTGQNGNARIPSLSGCTKCSTRRRVGIYGELIWG
jgi:hypothetical protein